MQLDGLGMGVGWAGGGWLAISDGSLTVAVILGGMAAGDCLSKWKGGGEGAWEY